MKTKLKRGILLALNACDGLPMPEAALLSAVRIQARPAQPTEGDIQEALQEVEGEGYASGVTDDFTQERSWTLTDKGVHQARKLR